MVCAVLFMRRRKSKNAVPANAAASQVMREEVKREQASGMMGETDRDEMVVEREEGERGYTDEAKTGVVVDSSTLHVKGHNEH